MTGFEHPEYMSVVFKRLTRCTPSAYRRKAKGLALALQTAGRADRSSTLGPPRSPGPSQPPARAKLVGPPVFGQKICNVTKTASGHGQLGVAVGFLSCRLGGAAVGVTDGCRG